jgi:hypothetical protein
MKFNYCRKRYLPETNVCRVLKHCKVQLPVEIVEMITHVYELGIISTLNSQIGTFETQLEIVVRNLLTNSRDTCKRKRLKEWEYFFKVHARIMFSAQCMWKLLYHWSWDVDLNVNEHHLLCPVDNSGCFFYQIFFDNK